MTLQSMPTRPQRRVRVARPRRFLMCRPAHFDVVYSINPWMEPDKPTDRDLALIQWERLVNLFRGLGHQVELIDPIAGLPDMVFSANGATVVDGKVLVARFRHEQRDAESVAYLNWFRARGWAEVRQGHAPGPARKALEPAPEPITAGQKQGQRVFLTQSCVLCHTIEGTTAHSRVGPDLTHLASRSLQSGRWQGSPRRARVPLLCCSDARGKSASG